MIIGIDLGGTSVSLGCISEGKLVKKIIEPSPSDKGLDESLSIFKNTIRQLVNPNIEGIGIGVPSVVDPKRGIVYNVANIPAWEEVHLKDILEEEFETPVFLDNDANCFALGEKVFGEGKSHLNMVGITLGTGVGAGLIIDGKLYGGSNTGAGEIGCIPYLDGVFEDYCASTFFTAHYNTTGKQLEMEAKKGNEQALKIWDEYGKHLGELIQTTLFAYDPDAIILGGSISKAYPFFEKAMRKNLQKFPYPKSLENLEIKISDNPDIAILGAAALIKI